MAAVLLTSGTFTFNDGNTGHSCNLGSAPAAGDADILCINSNTVVLSVVDPAGGAVFVADQTNVGSQGAYIFRRFATGGEGSTVTITTNGNHETQVGWSRWDNVVAKDTNGGTAVDGVSGSASPAHNTGALAATDELVIAFSAIHGLSATAPANPVWSAGYTPLNSATQGAGANGVTGFTAYNAAAGPAAENPSVTWTNAASDRYMLAVAYTTTTDNVASEGVLDAAATLSGESTIPVPLTALNFLGIVTGIGQCAADGLEIDSVAGLPCRVCLAIAGSIVADDCGCTCGEDDTRNGQLAVSVTQIYPSATFPTAAIDDGRQSRCGVAFLVAEVHVQVHRCVHTMDDAGNAPNCTDLLADAVVWHSDAAAIRKAVGCCVRDLKAAGTIKDFAIGATVPLGEQGGCTGSDLRVLVAISNCTCPA